MLIKKLIYCFVVVALYGCLLKASIEDGVSAYEEKDFIRAESIFLSNQENPVAMYYLAQMSFFGMGVHRNSEAAIEWLRRSAALGNAKSMLFLGGLYLEGYHGRDIKLDASAGIDLLLKAGKLGELDAYVKLGDYYSSPKFNGSMKELAFVYYTLSSSRVASKFHLVPFYEEKIMNGHVLAKDVRENLQEIIQTKENNMVPLATFARVRLAEYYYYGFAGKADFALAAKTLLPVIEIDAAAKILYAWLLYHGDGVPKDVSRAVKLWLESKDQKSYTYGMQSLHYIGLAKAYQSGSGVKQDIEKAKMYFNMVSWNIDGGGYWYAKMASDEFLGSDCPSMLGMWIVPPGKSGDNRFGLLAKNAYLSASKCFLIRSNSGKKNSEKSIDVQRADYFLKIAKNVDVSNFVINDERNDSLNARK